MPVVVRLIAAGALVVLAGLSACQRDAGRPGDATGGAATAPDTTPLVRFTVAELRRLDPAVSVAAWRQQQPADSMLVYRPGSNLVYAGPWCARATSRLTTPDGSIAIRNAYFYQPLPTSDPVPTADSAGMGRIERDCHLGMVVIAFPRGNADRAEEGARALRDGLRSIFLPGDSIPPLSVFGGSPNHWLTGTTIYGAERGSDRAPEDEGSALNDTIAVVAAALTTDSLAALPDYATELEATHVWLRGLMRRLGDQTDPGAARGVQSVVTRTWEMRPELVAGRAPDDSITEFPTAWIRVLDAAPAGDAARRAAAFLLADISLAEAMPLLRTATDSTLSTRARLLNQRGAGLDAFGNRLGAYGRAWLDSARALQGDDLVRGVGFVLSTMMRDEDCSLNLSNALAAGERLLPSLTDSSAAAAVHLLLGHAWADRLLERAGNGTPDEAARRKARDHVRRFLALGGRGHGSVRLARWQLWRLEAGLLPSSLYFGGSCGD